MKTLPSLLEVRLSGKMPVPGMLMSDGAAAAGGAGASAASVAAGFTSPREHPVTSMVPVARMSAAFNFVMELYMVGIPPCFACLTCCQKESMVYPWRPRDSRKDSGAIQATLPILGPNTVDPLD